MTLGSLLPENMSVPRRIGHTTDGGVFGSLLVGNYMERSRMYME